MIRFVLIPLVILAIVLFILAMLDCILRNSTKIWALPKAAWVMIILAVPVIGPLLWLTIGRGWKNSSSPY